MPWPVMRWQRQRGQQPWPARLAVLPVLWKAVRLRPQQLWLRSQQRQLLQVQGPALAGWWMQALLRVQVQVQARVRVQVQVC